MQNFPNYLWGKKRIDTRESEILVAKSQRKVVSSCSAEQVGNTRKTSTQKTAFSEVWQSLKTVTPEPVKKDKSKASKIPKKQSPRSQTRSCGRWLPLRLHDHFSYPRRLHSPKLRVWVSGFGWYNIITTGIIQSALRIRWHKPKHQWETSTYQGSWVNVWFEWDGPHRSQASEYRRCGLARGSTSQPRAGAGSSHGLFPVHSL